MKNRFVGGGLAAIALAAAGFAGSGPATAHHGLAQQFDMDARVKLNGVITRVYWQNPHIYYTLEVEQDGQKRTYNIESVPVGMARQAGLTPARLRNEGKRVTVTIRPGLREENLGWGTLLEFEDGSVVSFEGFNE